MGVLQIHITSKMHVRTFNLQHYLVKVECFNLVCIAFYFFASGVFCENSDAQNGYNFSTHARQRPLVQLVLLVRNKASVLPYTLNQIHELRYPKDRIILYMRADHCHDRSIDILEDFLHHVGQEYHKTDVVLDRSQRKFEEEENPRIFSPESYGHVVRLKEAALASAGDNGAEFVLFLDADVVITFPDLLDHLIGQNKSIVAPLVIVAGKLDLGNYWPAFRKHTWRQQCQKDCVLDALGTSDYDFHRRRVQMCMAVFLVHSCVLINLKKVGANSLTFDYRKLHEYHEDHQLDDDMVTLALSAREKNITTHVCNFERYGVSLPPSVGQSDEIIELELENLLVNVFDLWIAPLADYLRKYAAPTLPADKLGFDEIYYVNLDRRSQRRKAMELKFEALHIGPVLRVPAFDGKNLNASFLNENNIRAEENYKNPFTKAPLTPGEIGCFMSHHHIWEDVVSNRYQMALVFEDDFSFLEDFRSEVKAILDEVTRLALGWDVISLARVSWSDEAERKVEGSDLLVVPYTCHWTVAYMVSHSGARKLVTQQPLAKIIPVDLYLSALADVLPLGSKLSYEPRDLRYLASAAILGVPAFIEDVDSDFISDTI